MRWTALVLLLSLLLHIHSNALIAADETSTITSTPTTSSVVADSIALGDRVSSDNIVGSIEGFAGGDNREPNYLIKYTVVVDAGSTGSRAYIFKITYKPDLTTEDISTSIGMKVASGLSEFADRLDSVVNYFIPILENAASLIPEAYHSSADVFILGTAGMRLLDVERQTEIWNTLQEGLKFHPKNPFKLDSSNFGTIDGNLEAYYAVLSSNYIVGSIDSNLKLTKKVQMIGALDMGGSSAQLIFYKPPIESSKSISDSASSSSTITSPSSSPPLAAAKSTTVTSATTTTTTTTSLGSNKVRPEDFWSYSWLDYGNHRIRERVINHLISLSHSYESERIKLDNNGSSRSSNNHRDVELTGEVVFPDLTPRVLTVHYPCLFKNYDIKYNESILLKGSGDYSLCAETLNQVLWPEGNCNYNENSLPCKIDGISSPPVEGSFFGMSVYFYALDCIRHIGQHVGNFDIKEWPRPKLEALEGAVETFCNLDWDSIRDGVYANKHKYTPFDQLPFRCLDAVYQLTLLTKGFGFPRSSNSITLALEVEGREVEWTQGFVLAKNS